jgi:hypothetical protein
MLVFVRTKQSTADLPRLSTGFAGAERDIQQNMREKTGAAKAWQDRHPSATDVARAGWTWSASRMW